MLLFQPLIVLHWDCQLLYYQPNCFRKKKKKKNYKKNFFKGTLLKAGRAKIELASCVLVCGTCLHMTGTWKYHTSCWQLTVHVSRGFCCGFLLLPHNQQAKGNSRRKWAAREATAHPKHCLQHTEVSWPSSTQVPAHMAGTTKCHTHTSVRPLFQEINFWGIHSLFSVHWHLCISRSTAKYSQHPASQPAATDSEERPWMSKPLFVLHSGLVPWKLGAGAKVRRQTEAVRETLYFQFPALCLLAPTAQLYIHCFSQQYTILQQYSSLCIFLFPHLPKGAIDSWRVCSYRAEQGLLGRALWFQHNKIQVALQAVSSPPSYSSLRTLTQFFFLSGSVLEKDVTRYGRRNKPCGVQGEMKKIYIKEVEKLHTD